MLVDMLRDHEESGQQWVFLYKPTTAQKSRLAKLSSIAERLFEGIQTSDFPRFEWPNQGLIWADCRSVESNNNQGWLLKLYVTVHDPVHGF